MRKNAINDVRKDRPIEKRASDVMTQTNEPQWRTIAFFKRISLQYFKTTFLKRRILAFPLFIAVHAYVVWTSSGYSNLHSIFRLCVCANVLRLLPSTFPTISQ